MPRRSPPGNRLAIEALLADAEISTLAAMCVALEVPRDAWHRVPLLSRPWEQLAATRLVRRLRELEGFSEDRALRAAGERLGLDGEVLRSRARRVYEDGRLRS